MTKSSGYIVAPNVIAGCVYRTQHPDTAVSHYNTLEVNDERNYV